MSGGAKMLTCRERTCATTAAAGFESVLCVEGGAIAGELARHALRHLASSMPSPQQSSAGADMPMLSHGLSTDCAQALTAGPNASQKAISAATVMRLLCIRHQSISGAIEGQTKAEIGHFSCGSTTSEFNGALEATRRRRSAFDTTESSSWPWPRQRRSARAIRRTGTHSERYYPSGKNTKSTQPSRD
jgi:hypothetical protein